MISYRKLRILLMDKGLKLTNVCRECGLSTNIVTSINKDQSITLDSLERICKHLKIKIEDAVELIFE